MPAQPLARFAELVDPGADEAWRAEIRSTVEALRGRVVWHVNSTARGGGVAEMLRPLLGVCPRRRRRRPLDRHRGAAGVLRRHEAPPQPPPRRRRATAAPLGAAERRRLRARAARERGRAGGRSCAAATSWCCTTRRRPASRPRCSSRGRHRRLALPHRPRGSATAGARRPGRSCGPTSSTPTPTSSRAAPTCRPAAATRRVRDRPPVDRPVLAQEPGARRRRRARDPGARAASWRAGADGVVCASGATTAPPAGSTAAPTPAARRAPAPTTPLVVQVSRWDRLKDHLGVMHGLRRLDEAEAAARTWCSPGPSVTARRRRPRGRRGARGADRAPGARCRTRARRRVQLASLPMDDPSENAAMVNALQRHAAVVVQKSLQEGFGLTVTEAMWKGAAGRRERRRRHRRPDRRRRDGLLLDDPADLDALAAGLRRLLGDPAERIVGRGGARACAGRVARHPAAGRLRPPDRRPARLTQMGRVRAPSTPTVATIGRRISRNSSVVLVTPASLRVRARLRSSRTPRRPPEKGTRLGRPASGVVQRPTRPAAVAPARLSAARTRRTPRGTGRGR